MGTTERNKLMLPQVGAARAAQTPLYAAGRSHPVANLLGDLLHKHIRPEHFLTRPAGIAFDVALLRQAAQLGAQRVQVSCSDGRTFGCTFDDLRRYGFQIDRGFGPQWAMPLGRWSIDGAQPEQQVKDEARAVASAQLSLFDGSVTA